MGPTYQIPDTPGVHDAGSPNAYLKPGDPLIRPVPWAKGKVAEIMCDLYWNDGRPQGATPRHLLKRQLEQLHMRGYQLYSAYETEFQICQKDTLLPVSGRIEYANMNVLAKYDDLLCDITRDIKKVDIHVEVCELECSPGQFEFAFTPDWGILTVDNFLRFKDATKIICERYGYVPTFMSRPFAVHGASNGLHFNHSLWDMKKETNLFYSKDAATGLSDIGRYWVGGLMKHADALTAVCCPTVNCYRRLHTPWAPDKKDWAHEDRFTTIRVVKERGCRVENRLVAGSANVYVAAAATIAAGLDGIQNKTEPPPPGLNPDAAPLPYTLAEALQALKNDREMVAALGQEFVEWFCLTKQYELEEFKDHDMRGESEEELAKERAYFFHL